MQVSDLKLLLDIVTVMCRDRLVILIQRKVQCADMISTTWFQEFLQTIRYFTSDYSKFYISCVRSDVESALREIFDALFPSRSSDIGGNSQSSIFDAFIGAATFARDDEKNGESMSFDHFRNWCSQVPSLRRFLGSFLTPDTSGS